MRWNGPLEKLDDFRYTIPKDYKGEKGNLDMNTTGKIFVDENMLKSLVKDNALEQVANVACLPGIVGNAMAMPDIHWGYGFPIGGVAATDATDGVISPGGVGFDINCGVRLLRTDLRIEDVKDKIRPLIDSMFGNVPSGLGSKGKIRLERNQLADVFDHGAGWAVENGYGWDEDLTYLEENGCMTSADSLKVGDKPFKRGAPQLGSLGAGNHFLEIQKVEEILDTEAAKAYGIKEPGQIVIMIHTGSRGAGHQICTDYLLQMERATKKYNMVLPDRQLACAPVNSPEARDYYAAMSAGANFAWANRQLIVHWVRESFESVLGTSAEDLRMHIVYDVAHNIAKKEEHLVEGKKTEVYVHRKGATRAFGPGNPHIPSRYSDVGQPVLIPGDMGTASYLLAGTDKAMKETFGSTCHGAGRVMSRSAAIKRWKGDQIINDLGRQGIYVKAKSPKVVAEEAPLAYKRVDDVVGVAHGAGISKLVAKMVPLGVVKG